MLQINKISTVILLGIAFSSLAVFLFSCSDKKEETIASVYNPDSIPTVRTHNDTMYISDSGRIRFKVIGKTLMMFNNAKEPYTLFPDTAYMEEFDSLKNIVTILRADSVWNYSRKKLWKLRGNVEIINVEGDSFHSQELFWEEEKDRMYSDLYVVIQQPNKIAMRAYGFESNSSMTKYTFRRATNVDLYVDEDSEKKETENELQSEK